MDWILSHLYDVGLFAGGLIAGALGGSVITYRATTKNSNVGGTQVNQRGIRAGGDVVAGNKTTRP